MQEKRNYPKWKIQSFFGHLKTVHLHRKEVRRCCFACGLYWQGLIHDLSKYSFVELNESIRFYNGQHSPYNEVKKQYGFAYGWLHHKGRNRHHWEYWFDVQNGKYVAIEMPYRYLIESVCDRVAACKTYEKENYTQRSALTYYETRQERYLMHPTTSQKLYQLLKLIAEQGEEETFRQIKKSIQTNRPLV